MTLQRGDRIADVATLLARAAAEGAAPAVTFHRGRERVASATWGELADAVERAAVTLVRLGIVPGARVAVASANDLPLAVWLLAIWRVGAVAVPLNPNAPLREWSHTLEHADAHVAVVADALVDAVSSAGASAVYPFGAGWGAAGSSAAPLPPRAADNAAILLYTSGTTGMPKGVTLSQRNLVANATAMAARFRLAHTTQAAVLPLFHAHALGFGLMTALVSRGHLVLGDRFDPVAWPELVRAHAASWASVTPHLLPFLRQVGVHRRHVPSLRGLLVSSAPLPTDVARRFEETSQIPLVHGWGLSEFTNFACCTDPFAADDERRALMYDEDVPSVGTPLDGFELSVRGTWGERRGEGERGELCVRGASRMLGYWQDPTATERTLYGDWLRTGDEGYFRVRDGTPRFYVSGRIKEIVIRGGEKHSPVAVENRLIEAVPELVGRVVVLGFPHRVQGEELGAYVELDPLPPPLAERLLGAVERLAVDERPKVILHGRAPIPRTHTGKVQRARLRALFDGYADVVGVTRVEAAPSFSSP